MLPTSPSPLHAAITRTVAIIKNHALQHRFDIERRIQEASFEIVKERPMEFDTETDPDTLFALFGEDATSLAEGPVWVYVLERRRAVEVWNTLMGPKDPQVAKEEMPNSLRALYGISAEQNGLMGSPDVELAEIQIASVFVSSPPFPPSELPSESVLYDSLGLELQPKIPDERYAASNGRRPSTVSGRASTTSSGTLNTNGKPVFRARPIPASVLNPDIIPRTTRAAALRAGKAIEKRKEIGPRKTLTKAELTQTFLNVPGHKRATTIAVASTAAPTIAPRMTKAASLRIGQPHTPAPKPVRRSLTDGETRKQTFEGVPGHKRRETISVASTAAPTVTPRTNKSAALRAAQKESGAPPSSFRGPSIGLTPVRPSSSLAPTRASTALGTRPSLAPRLSNGVVARSKDDSDTPDKEMLKTTPSTPARRRPSSVALPPSITPRTNKSAALRAAKKEMENAQAAMKAAAARKPGSSRSSVAPSSFKPVVAT
ncbi:hypothetical protein M378DRAFT_164717 [Amanita muscaria Koide BX008]|uniref:Nucleoside diphosphate kinase n=1 Tax=Amanita muscaria (strain Koide BX008) TaxID=946122 RepID=A0A0C2X3C3_AMAMK|nr:hypothetical protein M378DRAFT_164717 [Amanita muscaria Koide BX008]